MTGGNIHFVHMKASGVTSQYDLKKMHLYPKVQ